MKKILKKFVPNFILDLKEKIKHDIYKDKIQNFAFYLNKNKRDKLKEHNDKFFFEIKNTKFVSSRGILNSTNIHNQIQYANHKSLSIKEINKILPHDSLYICSDALINFSKKTIDNIKVPFTLVSGNSDLEISPNTIGDKNFYKILNYNFLKKWYAQNLSFKNKKIINLPIGLDYQSESQGNHKIGKNRRLPFDQEQLLIKTLLESKKIEDRNFKIYSNWHFLISPERIDCLKNIDKSLCYFEEKRKYRDVTWKKQSEFTFVLCPSGFGFDTHRVWESMILGSIPIVKNNGIVNLFHDLPIIIVDDWSDINNDYLQNRYKRIINDHFNFSPLFLKYWQKKINNDETDYDLKPMTLKEFKTFLSN